MTTKLSKLLTMIAALTAVGMGVANAAQPIMDVYASGVKPIRVAIPAFRQMGNEPLPQRLLENLTDAFRRYVARTGVMEVIDPKAYIEDPAEVGALPTEQVYSNWSILNTDALVKTLVGRDGEEYIIELRLYDVGLQRFRKGKRFRGTEEQLPFMLGRFADVMSEELAGVEGIAFGEIAFVSDKTGNKEIYRIGFDGGKAEPITQNGSLNMGPRYTRDGRGVIFTSYIRRGKPHLYLYEFLAGRLSSVWTQGTLATGGAESPDGRRIALVQDDGKGNTHLLVLDKKSGQTHSLTSGYGITVSPTWSPDGAQIAYVSDRSGAPQIYVVGLDGGTPRRLTFQGRYNTSPSWSPKGSEIAFVRREGNEFNVYLIDTQGGREIQLTSAARSNEDPSWSPGGDYVIFSSNRRGNYDLYLLGAGGHFVYPVTDSPANETHPSWSPTGRPVQ